MARSKSSKRWLKEHVEDVYVRKAQLEGRRSRAWYKLDEINNKDHLLKPGMVVIDLGAAPGGWTEFVAEKVLPTGRVLALDLLPIDAIAGVEMIQGDFQEELVLTQLLSTLNDTPVDLVLSDMAPNISGLSAVDQPKAMYLVELALDLAQKVLKPEGHFLVKVFQGEGFDDFLLEMRRMFTKVIVRKPKASRPRSREVYLLGKSFISQ